MARGPFKAPSGVSQAKTFWKEEAVHIVLWVTMPRRILVCPRLPCHVCPCASTWLRGWDVEEPGCLQGRVGATSRLQRCARHERIVQKLSLLLRWSTRWWGHHMQGKYICPTNPSEDKVAPAHSERLEPWWRHRVHAIRKNEELNYFEMPN